MQDPTISLNPNRLVAFLKKSATDFTSNDIISFIEAHDIRMVNFRYVAEDGKLKTLNFVVNCRNYLRQILTYGERVDGSSLFSFIDAGSSDLYIIPRFRTAFVNPFSETPALDILCSFYTNEGRPLENAPDYVLRKAHQHFKDRTGMTFKALAELEYYINSEKETNYVVDDLRGYHLSAPFAKWEAFRQEAMMMIASAGGMIKYGHNEVGNFTSETEAFEQHEIEFLSCEAEAAADQVVIAKWILRQLASEYGIELSFAPKISVGKAGSGLHIHMMLEKNGVNMMVDGDHLSDQAKKMIAGILELSPAITAFGNTIPTSYLRLVPNQEAPTSICWGDRNRSVLVRVPLGWLGQNRMVFDANPAETAEEFQFPGKQTVEFRAADGSADLHYLIAGLIVASLHGLESSGSIEKAERLYASSDIHKDSKKMKSFDRLPASCYESAQALKSARKIFEKDSVFPSGMIDNVIKKLTSYDDRGLSERLYGKTEEIRLLVLKYIHIC
ncbi:MAG TPA: glutamine synthetase family protein [Bacteroidales bacterium]|nr:glutamine synthetase family protein [Bacteroidales bacterium]